MHALFQLCPSLLLSSCIGYKMAVALKLAAEELISTLDKGSSVLAVRDQLLLVTFIQPVSRSRPTAFQTINPVEVMVLNMSVTPAVTLKWSKIEFRFSGWFSD